MAIIHANENKGDDSNLGTLSSPFKTLERCVQKVKELNVEDVTIKLSIGNYDLGGIKLFSAANLSNVNLLILGAGGKTVLVQKSHMGGNGSTVGSPSTTITMAKLTYHFKETTSTNYNIFAYKWIFRNVLFTGTLNDSYGLFLPNSGGSLFMYNCVKLTDTTSFLRAADGVIEVRDSQGYFTNGYLTSNDKWDKGGNQLNTTDNYLKTLNKGMFKWLANEKLILSKDNDYGYYKTGAWHSLGNSLPECNVIKTQGMPSLETLNPGEYDFTHPMTTNAPQKQYSGVINFNDEGLKNIKQIDVREVEIDG